MSPTLEAGILEPTREQSAGTGSLEEAAIRSVIAFLSAPLPRVSGPFFIQDDNGEPGLFDPNSRKPIDLTYREDAEAWCLEHDAGIYSVTTVKPRWKNWRSA